MADLNHSFDHFAFTSEEKEQLTDRLKQAAEQEERMKEPTKRIIRHTGHRLLIGAGAAAALTMGALAATVGGGLLGYFEARTPEDQSALENGIYRLDRSESWNRLDGCPHRLRGGQRQQLCVGGGDRPGGDGFGGCGGPGV